MKQIKYTPDAADKLRALKSAISQKYGADKAKKIIKSITVSAKYSCGFSNTLISSIIVGERYLDYFTTITEDRL